MKERTSNTETITENNTTIRPAAPSDLDFIRNLSRDVFSRYGPYDTILSGWFQSGTTMTGLALIDGIPTGFAMLRLPDEKMFEKRIAELVAIAVVPEKQRCGIGDLLMQEVFTLAERLQIDTLMLCTAVENKPAQQLFNKHGFSPWHVEKGYYDGGQEALVMVKILVE